MKLEIYSEEEFSKLAETLYLDNVDLKGFPDLSMHPEPGGKPTAIPYIWTKQLMLILGEEKAGKTWMALYLACRMAYNPSSPKLVIYFYGEGEETELKERLNIVRQAWCHMSGATKGEVLMVNLNDREWGDEGFDLKRMEHQEYFRAKLKEVKQKSEYDLEAIILDNYASLMGRVQEGNVAIKLLQFLKGYQREGLAVLLACHTSLPGQVAGSRQLPRRANGIITLTRKALWKQEIKQKIDEVVKRNSRTKADPCQAIENMRDAIKQENNEEADQLTRLTLHVSFQRFRNAPPPPEEHTINLKECSMESVTVTNEVKNKYADDYCNNLLRKLSPTTVSAGKDRNADDVEPEDSENLELDGDENSTAVPLSHLLQDIKAMDNTEEQIAALRQIVKEHGCKTQTDLAEVLGCKIDDLKNFKRGKIHNEDLGLQDYAGRPRK